MKEILKHFEKILGNALGNWNLHEWILVLSSESYSSEGEYLEKEKKNISNRNWGTIGMTIRVRCYNSVYHYIRTYNTGYFILIDPREYLLNYTLSEKVYQIKLSKKITLFLEGYFAMIANLV